MTLELSEGPDRAEVSLTTADDGNESLCFLRFEVFTAVTMKTGAFLDAAPCGSGKNRRFGGT
jgi:hypothetical protein